MANFDEFMHDMMTPGAEETREVAKSMYCLFSNLIHAGFTEDQAMTILLKVIGGTHADNV